MTRGMVDNLNIQQLAAHHDAIHELWQKYREPGEVATGPILAKNGTLRFFVHDASGRRQRDIVVEPSGAMYAQAINFEITELYLV